MTVRYSTIAADIKTKLEGISGTGIIHAYERQTVAQGKFIDLFKDSTGKICGWEITRRAAPETYTGPTNRHHQLLLHGYQGLQDAAASASAFQDLCDDICDLFRDANAPTGATWQYRNGLEPGKTPVQLELIDDRMFGNVLCHHAVISITITERIF